VLLPDLFFLLDSTLELLLDGLIELVVCRVDEN
jgi:hypothetical protein